MSARLFCCIKKTFSSFPKAVLLPLVFLLLFLVKTTPAAADINTYKNLFLQGSTLSATGPILNSTNQNMVGEIFQLHLAFSSNPQTEADIENAWSHVSTSYYSPDVTIPSNGDAFILRVCSSTGGTQSCVYFRLTYDNYTTYQPLYNASKIYVIYREVPNYNDAGVTGLLRDTGSLVGLTQNEFSGVSTNDITITSPGSVPEFNNDGSPSTVNPTSNNQSFFTINSDGSTSSTTLKLPLTGGTATADVWYCGVNTSDDTNATNEYKNDTSVKQFGNLCGGDSYFQATPTINITIPQSSSAAATQAAVAKSSVTAAATANTTQNKVNSLTECGIVPGLDSGTINGCAAQLAYGFYQLCAWVAGLFGELFDFFIGYSVSSASYSYPFVVTGWTLVRNISNIFFIIIMVWSGFSAVFDTSATSMKKVVPALIINAFLINFSLFFTRVVIDISNIGARMFYSEMLVCKQTDLVNGSCPPAKAQTGLGGYWPLSEKIVSAFDPQTMFKPAILLSPTTNTDGTQNAAQSAANVMIQSGARETSNYYAIISLIAAALMITIAIMFFKVSFLFLGRVVGLYICMIFSPFAFLSRSIPLFDGVERLRWSDWLKELSNYAMMAPIFVFFLYIIYTFLSSNFVQQIGVQSLASAGFFATVLSIAIPMLIIYFLMQAAQKAAENLSGQIGSAIQKFGEQATGLALGAATGGASFIGSNTLGRAANKISNNEGFKDWAANNGTIGRMALKSVDSVGKSSFDARNTTVGKGFSKQFGLNLDQKALGFAGLDTKSSKGGYRQTQEDKVKAAEEYKKLLVTKKSDDEIKAGYSAAEIKKREDYDKEQDKKLNDRWLIEKTKNDNGFAEKVRENPSDYGVDGKEWKKYKKANKDEEYQKAKNAYQKTKVPPPVYLTATETNKARTDAYAEKMEKKSGGAFAQQNYYNSKNDLVVKKGELMRNPYATEQLTGEDGAPVAKGAKIANKNAWQAFAEMGEGAAKGAAIGLVIGTAVPVVGTAVGFAAGGTLGIIKGGLNYSGTTNKRIGGAFRTEPKKKEKIIDDLLKEVKKDADEAAPAPEPVAPTAPAGGGTNPPATP